MTPTVHARRAGRQACPPERGHTVSSTPLNRLASPLLPTARARHGRALCSTSSATSATGRTACRDPPHVQARHGTGRSAADYPWLSKAATTSTSPLQALCNHAIRAGDVATPGAEQRHVRRHQVLARCARSRSQANALTAARPTVGGVDDRPCVAIALERGGSRPSRAGRCCSRIAKRQRGGSVPHAGVMLPGRQRRRRAARGAGRRPRAVCRARREGIRRSA